MTVVSRGTGAVAGLVMAAAVLAGCSSSDEEDGPPGGAESPGTSSSAPTSPTTSASPSEDPTPEVTATGPEVTLEGEGGGKSFTFTTPDKRWTVGVGTSQLITVKGGNYIEGYVISVPGTRDIDSYIRDQNDLYKSRGFKLERGEDLTVDGVEGITIEASNDQGLFFQYGAQNGESFVTLVFEFPKDDATTRGWIDAVLASARWS